MKNSFYAKGVQALAAFKRAREHHRQVLELKPQVQFHKDFARGKNLPGAALAYWLIFIAEVFILGLSASVFFQTSFGIDPGQEGRALIGMLFSAVIALGFHFMLPRASYAIFSKYYIEYHAGLYRLDFLELSEEDASYKVRQDLKRQYPYSLRLMILMVLGSMILMLARIYITGNHDIGGQNDLFVQLIVLGISVFLLFLLFVLSIWVDIYQRQKKIERSYKKHIKGRERELNMFMANVDAIPDSVKDEKDLLYMGTRSGVILDCLRHFEALQKDEGDLSCLIPERAIAFKLLWEGAPVENVKVIGLTKEERYLLGRSNQQGLVTLKWRSFEEELDFVAIGGRKMKNVRVQSDPYVIELVDDPQGTLMLED